MDEYKIAVVSASPGYFWRRIKTEQGSLVQHVVVVVIVIVVGCMPLFASAGCLGYIPRSLCICIARLIPFNSWKVYHINEILAGVRKKNILRKQIRCKTFQYKQ